MPNWARTWPVIEQNGASRLEPIELDDASGQPRLVEMQLPAGIKQSLLQRRRIAPENRQTAAGAGGGARGSRFT